MNVLQIIQLILTLAPSGITLTQDVIALIQAIETAINGTPGTPEHTAAVATLQAKAGPTT